jgi:hypothetical protein
MHKLGVDGSVKILLIVEKTRACQKSRQIADEPVVAVIAQLSALGFVVSQHRSPGKVLAGRLPVEKLADLANISAVHFALPVRR